MDWIFRKSKFFWRLIGKMNRRMIANYGKNPRLGRFILLLTTCGCKTGRLRVTPVQYVEEDGIFYVGAGRGAEADWFRNLCANPQVAVQVGERHFAGLAQVMTDPLQVADFLQLRLRRQPFLMGLMLAIEGLPLKAKRADLEKFAPKIVAVAIHPETPGIGQENHSQET
jgi:deazaflavin-dependent oxidoreductase (nitroreductase family)